jgi:hypothetical protein
VGNHCITKAQSLILPHHRWKKSCCPYVYSNSTVGNTVKLSYKSRCLFSSGYRRCFHSSQTLQSVFIRLFYTIKKNKLDVIIPRFLFWLYKLLSKISVSLFKKRRVLKTLVISRLTRGIEIKCYNLCSVESWVNNPGWEESCWSILTNTLKFYSLHEHH